MRHCRTLIHLSTTSNPEDPSYFASTSCRKKDRLHKVAGHTIELSVGNLPKVAPSGGRDGSGLSRQCERVGIKLRLFGPRVLYIDRRRFDFKPQAECPQQEWIADQDVIPTVHDGFYPLPRRPHCYSPLFEPVDHFLRGIAYLKTAYVLDKQRHLARLKVFGKVPCLSLPEPRVHAPRLNHGPANARRTGPRRGPAPECQRGALEHRFSRWALHSNNPSLA